MDKESATQTVTASDPGGAAVRPTLYFPLNSKRLKGTHLGCIARTMKLPERGAVSNLRVIIEGALLEMGKEACNVQVGVQEEDVTITLTDATGVFLTAEPEEQVGFGGDGSSDGGDSYGSGDGGDGSGEGDTGGDGACGDRENGGETLEEQLAAASTLNEKLRGKNEALSCAIDILQTEVSRLNERVGQEERRVKEIWRASCAQVANSDAMIASKEEEIERLKARIEELDKPHHRTPVSGVPPSMLPLTSVKPVPAAAPLRSHAPLGTMPPSCSCRAA